MMSKQYFYKSIYGLFYGGLEYRMLYRMDGRGHITQIRLFKDEYDYLKDLLVNYDIFCIFNREAANIWIEALKTRKPERASFDGLRSCVRNELALQEDGYR